MHPDPVQQQQWGPLPRPRANGGPPMRKQLQVQAPTAAIRAGPCGLMGHGTWPWPHHLRGAAPHSGPWPKLLSLGRIPGRPIAHKGQPLAKIPGGRRIASLDALQLVQRLSVPGTCVGRGTVSLSKHVGTLALSWLWALRHCMGSVTAGDAPRAGRRQRPDPGIGRRCSPQPLPGRRLHRGHSMPSPMPPTSPSQPYILLHMPIWSRPALWNVKKYVFLGWDPRAGTPMPAPAQTAPPERRCVPGAGKKEPDQLATGFGPLQPAAAAHALRHPLCPRCPGPEGLPPGGLAASCPERAQGEERVQGAGERGLAKWGFGRFLRMPGGGEAAGGAAPPPPASGNLCAAQTTHAARIPCQKPRSFTGPELLGNAHEAPAATEQA